MSHRPKQFGVVQYDLTGQGRARKRPLAAPPEGKVPSKLACVEESESLGPSLRWKGWLSFKHAPPRAAYSHCASVGKRYTRPRPTRWLSRAQNESFPSAMSCQLTFSTGKRRVSRPA